jgi:hypothetical protein
MTYSFDEAQQVRFPRIIFAYEDIYFVKRAQQLLIAKAPEG